MSRSRPQSGTRRGFTLVEAMATIVILGVLGSIASGLILSAVDGYTNAATRAQLHVELSIALDRLTRECRRIALDEGAAGVAPNIASVTPTSMTWNNTYSLTLSGSQLMFVENGAAASVLLDDVSSFSIATYDESNAALGANLSGTGCDPIRRIALDVTLARYGITEALRTKVFIRSTLSGMGAGG